MLSPCGSTVRRRFIHTFSLLRRTESFWWPSDSIPCKIMSEFSDTFILALLENIKMFSRFCLLKPKWYLTQSSFLTWRKVHWMCPVKLSLVLTEAKDIFINHFFFSILSFNQQQITAQHLPVVEHLECERVNSYWAQTTTSLKQELTHVGQGLKELIKPG